MRAKDLLLCLLGCVGRVFAAQGQITESKYLGDLSLYTVDDKLVPLLPIVSKKEHSFVLFFNSSENNRSRNPDVDSLQKLAERYGFNVQPVLIKMLPDPDRPAERATILQNLRLNAREVSYPLLYDPVEIIKRKTSSFIRPTQSAAFFARFTNGATDWIQNCILLVDKAGKIKWQFGELPRGEKLVQICRVLDQQPASAKIRLPEDGKMITLKDGQRTFADLLAAPKFKIISMYARESALKYLSLQLKNMNDTQLTVATVAVQPIDTAIVKGEQLTRYLEMVTKSASENSKAAVFPAFLEIAYYNNRMITGNGAATALTTLWTDLSSLPAFKKEDSQGNELWVLLTPDNRILAWDRGAYGLRHLFTVYQLNGLFQK